MAIVDLTIGASLLADDRTARLLTAEANAIEALSLAPDHAQAHRVLGGVYMFSNRAAWGIAECERALELDRNLADAARSVSPNTSWVGLQRPKAISSRLSASLLATSLPIAGCIL
jgi:hypothetical protein